MLTKTAQGFADRGDYQPQSADYLSLRVYVAAVVATVDFGAWPA